ncbi:hypothetical protein M413DRAFT_438769 [Hebeloma cylindrosporum]|uniref:Uncharacterized protein n=1 Tax=Hebeloma cylindrosporum TaxID=76867 RepID=A0A0C2Z8Z4_HEBCY|nr:hypothetical protein M413DRAFT_438769 [Hebeloma cylindrosporum h7]
MGNCTSPEIQASTTEQAVALSYAKNIPALKYIDVARNVPLEIRGSPTWWRVVRQVFGAENDFAVNVKPLDTNQGISKKGWYDRAAWGI